MSDWSKQLKTCTNKAKIDQQDNYASSCYKFTNANILNDVVSLRDISKQNGFP